MNIVGRQCLRIFKSDQTQQGLCNILGRTLAYKSAVSLDKLYPTSNLKLYTPTFVPEDPNVKFDGYIPLQEIDITYSRSSGAGGQHVNRTNTKVDVRFQIQNAKWLSEEIKEKLTNKYKSKLTKEGYLIIKSELTRSQQLNLADALEKLRSMIREVIKPPPEVSQESLEMKRKQRLRAARERLYEKRMHSENKRSRQTSLDF
ncbi:peptidyl-tRNA hydrolase ICT1, mitochondrial [Hylaeus anthracinus]|uniref:peptidyl-tRNA hydrolase ICT1, mitochondrial n=1 Tax=Hylaeus anthracinus TaxID=313031 RepID=UPI0023B9AE8C|nr:peptidyl-tRNA hydrolase ICT1, mitochondrial [Hylaeus anthracinus]